MEPLAAEEPDIPLRSWYGLKTELKQSEYWTYIRHVNIVLRQTELHP